MWREHFGYLFQDNRCKVDADLEKLERAMFMDADEREMYSVGFRLEILYDRVYWRWNPCVNPKCDVPCVSKNILGLHDDARGRFHIHAAAGGNWSCVRREMGEQ